MKIVLLGSTGQLGGHLCQTLRGEIVALSRADADLTKPDRLRQSLEQVRPQLVVNAAGYTQVDRAEAEPAEAFAVNTLGGRDLAAICRDIDSTLLHVSTDYIFGLDLLRTSPYCEDDAPGPLNVYGARKLAGEQFVRAICPKFHSADVWAVRPPGVGPSAEQFRGYDAAQGRGGGNRARGG